MLESLEWCFQLGIEEVSVFALSRDNLKREKVEVDTLMNLAKKQFTRFAEESEFFQENEIRVRVLGELSILPKDVQDALRRVEDQTK